MTLLLINVTNYTHRERQRRARTLRVNLTVLTMTNSRAWPQANPREKKPTCQGHKPTSAFASRIGYRNEEKTS